jgi:hypothetical protein
MITSEYAAGFFDGEGHVKIDKDFVVLNVIRGPFIENENQWGRWRKLNNL